MDNPMMAPDDLGLGAAPSAPLLPQPVQPKSMHPAAQAIITAIAAGLGPGRGTGILQGMQASQQQAQMQARQGTQDAYQQYQREQQMFQQEQQAYQAKQRAVADAVKSLGEEAPNLTSRIDFDGRANAYASYLRGMGINVSPQFLTRSVPYLEPTERDLVAKAVEKNLKAFPKAWESGVPMDAHIEWIDPKTKQPRDMQIGQAMQAGLIAPPVDAQGKWLGAQPKAAEKETRSIPVQAAEALAAGDMATYNRLLRVDKEFAESGRPAPRGPLSPRDRFSVQPVTNADGTTSIMRVNIDTGVAEPVTLPAGVAGAGRPNETERTSRMYYDRAVPSDQTAKTFEAKLTTLGRQFNSQLPNVLASPDGQQYRQSQDEFINAALRRESGAAISDAEYDRFARIYFVRPGDSLGLIRQKQQARERVIAGFKQGAGNLGAVSPVSSHGATKRKVYDLNGKLLREE